MTTKQRICIICLFLAGLALVGCQPGPSLDATPGPATTRVPAATATSVPTATATPIPVPGEILIMMNRALVSLPADPSGGNSEAKIIISQKEFDRSIPIPGEIDTPVTSLFLSPDGTKFALYTCKIVGYSCFEHRVFISTIDLSSQVTILNYEGGLLAWSPTSEHILLQGNKNPQDKFVVGGGDDFAYLLQLPPADAAFWSYDGKQIYFYRDGWHVINSDGTNEQEVTCDLCALAPTPSSFAVAQSPDGEYVAIGYRDGTVFIVRQDNFADFKIGSAGSYISRLFWSPDGSRLAVNVDTSTSQSDIVILDKEGVTVEKMTRPEGVNLTILCGWSPDSQYIDYLTIRENGYDLFLHKIGETDSIQRLSIETSDQNCPVWLD
ncbi:MAG: hypothetical protein AB1649_18540 [Chloroflexota bacterium]